MQDEVDGTNAPTDSHPEGVTESPAPSVETEAHVEVDVPTEVPAEDVKDAVDRQAEGTTNQPEGNTQIGD